MSANRILILEEEIEELTDAVKSIKEVLKDLVSVINAVGGELEEIKNKM